jgi:hypothetical protein
MRVVPNDNPMANDTLIEARRGKKDEFYTQLCDVERELLAYVDYNPNVFHNKTILLPADDPEWSAFTQFFLLQFKNLGLKKLISTSYNPGGRGKVFTYTTEQARITANPLQGLQCTQLKGDGDFRSDEIRKLRDQSDFVITNPPFSLFREFLAWILEGGQQFSIIGNMNAVTCKEVFPLIQQGGMWLGPSISSGDREFRVPDHYPLVAAGCRIDTQGNRYISVKGVRWFTNIDHGKRHEPLHYLPMDKNVQVNKRIEGKPAYQRYDNYDAIEVPASSAIPCDYAGVMGVPITYLDKYCPEQFEIIGISENGDDSPVAPLRLDGSSKYDRPYINGKRLYSRIFIKPL